MSLSDISIKRPIMVSMLLIVFVIFGGLAYFSLSLDLFPDVEIGYVTIQTVYPGAGPREIETQVTKKIEDTVATVSKIDFIRSYSMDSVSIVIIKFEIGKSPDIANKEVKDKIDAILNDLPDDCETPVVEKLDLRAKPVLDIVLSGNMDIKDLYELADKKLKDRFSQIEGVARVILSGGREREIRVELDQRTVYENAISLPQLSQILKAQNMDLPGGQFQNRSQEFSVRFKGEFNNVQDMEELDVPTPFGMKKLGNLAHIHDTGSDVRERTTFFNNIQKSRQDNVVLLSILKSADGNTVKMARRLIERLPLIEKELPAGCKLTLATDKSVLIEASVEDTLGNIFLGVLLTGLVLLFFLHDLRSTIIVAIAMPFSIISTFMILQISGFSLNFMTLMGLSTSVGVLVSNSVVVLENIFRHKEMGHGRVEAARKGTAEITVAVLASTLTNIVVFLPIASMSSLIGQFFKEFALTVTYATVFSLIVSFTLTPMLASRILPDTDTKKHPIGKALEKLFHLWEKGYAKTLNIAIKTRSRSFIVLVIAIIMFFLSFISAARIGFEFFPKMDEGDITIEVELPQGYNLDENAKLIQTIENRLEKRAEIKHMLTTLGSLNETDLGVNLAKINIKLVDREEREILTEDAASQFIQLLSDIPNARIRVSASSSTGNEEAPLKFYLLGQETTQLEIYKNDIIKRIQSIDGLINLSTSSRPGKPEITLLPDRQKLSESGLNVYDLALTLRTSIEGIVASRYKEAGEEFDIRVVMNKASVDSPEKIRNIPIISRTGVFRLAELTDIRFDEGFSNILHKDKFKAIEFSGDTAPGYPLGNVVNKIREQIKDMNLPAGYKVDWGSDVKMMEETAIDMLRTFIIAFLLTYMLLAAILENLTQPLMILGTIPLALIGVFVALDITGKTMNTMSMMAIVMLVGIVVNNAILLLDYTNILRREGKGVTEALLEACPTKLKPILMSTIAIILGMLPMALGIGSAGREVRQPMGVVSIGGLVVSTLLTLYVIPAIYNLTTRRKTKNSPDTETI